MANEKNEPSGITLQIDAPTPITHDRGPCNTVKQMRLPQPLTLEEKKYLLAVERGDLPNVRRILQRAIRKHHINVNCMDPLGRRAFTLAIDSENLEMVELLVVMGVETKDALLQAINAEFVEAVEFLLEHEELIHNEGDPYSWHKVDLNTALFQPDITPLILAAHKDNYEILKLLLDRGAAVPTPHDIKCGCEECIRLITEDPLRHSLMRVNMYKALSSPSLISLSSNDPLLRAFQLSWELKYLSFTEQECKSDYMELRKQCQQYAVDLLDQTRTSKELAIILNYDPLSPPYQDGDRMSLARLELAIKYKQKKFVAHPNIQQLLGSIWYEGLPGFRRKSNIGKIMNITKIAILFPIYCMIYIIAPNCTTGKLMRKPFMKFLIHASSYLFFLFILILVSQRAEDDLINFFGTKNMKQNLAENMKKHRGKGPTLFELVVLSYVCGFIWEEIQEIYTIGISNYLRNLWNFIDFTRNGLYISVICLRIFAYIQQNIEISQKPEIALIAREKWHPFDPQLIAEGLFAAANIFSALKLIHLFSINPHLGPLQISLGRMVIDIIKFFFIYSLVLFAFACGLNQLLWYFADLEKLKCYSLPDDEANWANNSDSCMKWRRFGNLFESSQSLFWASFGMIGIENFELEGIKSYTRFWGLLMFGSYSVINVIVLLNLLIAMMSNSYAMIEQHSDTEWKFARTKLWMSYFEDSPTLPPPFNILPSVKWCIRVFRKSKKELAYRASLKRQEAERDNQYTNIMRALVWRYVCDQHRKLEESAVTEDDINEVQGFISTMRYELLDIFKRNGMDVSSASKHEKPVRAKRTKIWERRLMKDFQVVPVSSHDDDDGQCDSAIDIKPPPVDENPKSKFRRIARQIAKESITHKWTMLLQSVAKDSQIGRCCNHESYENQKNLQKAMEEAQRLILLSPLPPHPSNTDFLDENASSLLGLLNNIAAEVRANENSTSDHGFNYRNTICTPKRTDRKSIKDSFTNMKDKISSNTTVNDIFRSISPRRLSNHTNSPQLNTSKSSLLIEGNDNNGDVPNNNLNKNQLTPSITVTEIDNKEIILSVSNLTSEKTEKNDCKKLSKKATAPMPPEGKSVQNDDENSIPSKQSFAKSSACLLGALKMKKLNFSENTVSSISPSKSETVEQDLDKQWL